MKKAKRRKTLRSAAALLKTLREGPRLGDDDLEDALSYAAAGDDKITPVLAELVKNNKDLRSHVGSRMISLRNTGFFHEAVVGGRLAMAARSLDGVAATTALLLAWDARTLGLVDADEALSWCKKTHGKFIDGHGHRTAAWARCALAAGDVDGAKQAVRALIDGAHKGLRHFAGELDELIADLMAEKSFAKVLGAPVMLEARRAAKVEPAPRETTAVKKGRWRG